MACPFDHLIQDSLELMVKYPPGDTLEKQEAMQKQAMKSEKPQPKRLIKYITPQNVLSATIFVLVGAIIYQLYSEYSRKII